MQKLSDRLMRKYSQGGYEHESYTANIPRCFDRLRFDTVQALSRFHLALMHDSDLLKTMIVKNKIGYDNFNEMAAQADLITLVDKVDGVEYGISKPGFDANLRENILIRAGSFKGAKDALDEYLKKIIVRTIDRFNGSNKLEKHLS